MKKPKVGMIIRAEWVDSGCESNCNSQHPAQVELIRLELFGRVLAIDDEGIVICYAQTLPDLDPDHDIYMKIAHNSYTWTELVESTDAR